MTLTCRLLKSVELNSKRGLSHRCPPTDSCSPTANLPSATCSQYTICPRDRTPSFGEITSTCCLGSHSRSTRTRAPRGLTFSVMVLVFKPWFIVETNFQDHRFRDSFFHSASRHRHCHIHLPGQRFSMAPRWPVCSMLVRLSPGRATSCLHMA